MNTAAAFYGRTGFSQANSRQLRPARGDNNWTKAGCARSLYVELCIAGLSLFGAEGVSKRVIEFFRGGAWILNSRLVFEI